MKANKSKIQQDTKRCYICGRLGATDKHHIFNGGERDKSEEDGMYVFLHRSCHRKVHNDPEKMKKLKRIGQAAWEQTGSREEFIKRYRKNYIIDEEEENVRSGQSDPDYDGDPANTGER